MKEKKSLHRRGHTPLSGTAKVVLALTLVATVLSIAACGGKGGAAPSAAAPSSDKTFPGGWKPTANYDKRVPISMATVGATEGVDNTNGDEWAKFFSSNFNFDLDLTVLSYDNWSERIRLWVSSGDMPDIAVFDYQHTDAANWVEEGLLKKLPDNWRTRWPNIAKQYDVTVIGPELERRFGGVYFLPRPRFADNLPGIPVPDHITWYYRKDWARAVGFPIKTVYTIPEALEYARLIKEKDPGKLGSKLLPLSNRPEWAMRFFVQSNSTYYKSFYKDKDGLYKWGPASEDTLTGLKLYYKAYAEGLLNSEFYTLKDWDDYNQFGVSLISGSFYGEGTGGHLWLFSELLFAENSGQPPEDVGFGTIVGYDGHYHQVDLINYWGALMFKPDIDDDKFFRIMDMLDFMSTKKGYEMQNLGFEGVDWEYRDGAYINLLEGQVDESGAQISTMTKYPSKMNTPPYLRLYDDFSFNNPGTDKVYRDASWEIYTSRVKLGTPDTLTQIDWDLWCYDSPVMRRAAAFQFDQEYANLVTGAKSEADLETRWRQWVERNNPIIQPALDELNSKLK
jgi:putative aldouronate transport system substrate-binding protein